MYSLLGVHLLQHQEQHLVIVNGDYIAERMFMKLLPVYMFRQFLGSLRGYLHREAASLASFALQQHRAAEHRHNTLYY